MAGQAGGAGAIGSTACSEGDPARVQEVVEAVE